MMMGNMFNMMNAPSWDTGVASIQSSIEEKGKEEELQLFQVCLMQWLGSDLEIWIIGKLKCLLYWKTVPFSSIFSIACRILQPTLGGCFFVTVKLSFFSTGQ